MRVKLLSKRYAKALFDLAGEMKILDKVDADLRLVREVFSENRNLKLIIANPVIDIYKKNKILTELFSGKIEDLSMKYIQLITIKGREQFITHICEAFDDIYKEYKNILPVNVTTADKADKKIMNDISSKLEEATKMNIEITEKVNEEIIGGFVIDFQDYQYDASIINQLNKLKKGFSENLYEIQF
ncbi:MAG: ATP synthase F1 subunit delta [Lentimicrobiaceae bacterium]|jgi:F-type H+-transporting ATPase subunit delta|nr:ATP synthase F1 subunit delta [Lentimicrobiaceae bacterium]|tara:strand:+ start:33060 stop:33617 length:558 start_codon:yes stop_codon:yes gene_type:complete